MGATPPAVATAWLCSLLALAAGTSQSCPAPRAPRYGGKAVFSDGAEVRFGCQAGYLLEGQPRAWCVRGRWTSPPPTCRPAAAAPPTYAPWEIPALTGEAGALRRDQEDEVSRVRGHSALQPDGTLYLPPVPGRTKGYSRSWEEGSTSLSLETRGSAAGQGSRPSRHGVKGGYAGSSQGSSVRYGSSAGSRESHPGLPSSHRTSPEQSTAGSYPSTRGSSVQHGSSIGSRDSRPGLPPPHRSSPEQSTAGSYASSRGSSVQYGRDNPQDLDDNGEGLSSQRSHHDAKGRYSSPSHYRSGTLDLHGTKDSSPQVSPLPYTTRGKTTIDSTQEGSVRRGASSRGAYGSSESSHKFQTQYSAKERTQDGVVQRGGAWEGQGSRGGGDVTSHGSRYGTRDRYPYSSSQQGSTVHSGRSQVSSSSYGTRDGTSAHRASSQHGVKGNPAPPSQGTPSRDHQDRGSLQYSGGRTAVSSTSYHQGSPSYGGTSSSSSQDSYGHGVRGTYSESSSRSRSESGKDVTSPHRETPSRYGSSGTRVSSSTSSSYPPSGKSPYSFEGIYTPSSRQHGETSQHRGTHTSTPGGYDGRYSTRPPISVAVRVMPTASVWAPRGLHSQPLTVAEEEEWLRRELERQDGEMPPVRQESDVDPSAEKTRELVHEPWLGRLEPGLRSRLLAKLEAARRQQGRPTQAPRYPTSAHTHGPFPTTVLQQTYEEDRLEQQRGRLRVSKKSCDLGTNRAPYVRNAYVSRYIKAGDQQEAVYRCISRHTLANPTHDRLQCIDGVWTHPNPPRCVRTG